MRIILSGVLVWSIMASFAIAGMAEDRTSSILNLSKYRDYEKVKTLSFTFNKKTNLKFEMLVQKKLVHKDALVKRTIAEIKKSIVKTLNLLNPNYNTKQLKFYIYMGDNLGTYFGSYVHYSRILHVGLSNWEKKFKNIDSWNKKGIFKLNDHFLASIFAHEFFHFHQFYFYDWTKTNPSLKYTKNYRELMAQIFEGLYLASINLESYMMEYFHLFRIYNNPLVETRNKSRFSAYTYLSKQFRCILNSENEIDLKLKVDWAQRCQNPTEVKNRLGELIDELHFKFKPHYPTYNQIIDEGKELYTHLSSYFMKEINCNIKAPYHDVENREKDYHKYAENRMSFDKYNSITNNWMCMSWYYTGDSKSDQAIKLKRSLNIPFRRKVALN
ncbi:hypothetical protein N9N67_07235 [Bacteriovoracaceae bacterium]|nr:hypothetical protein [Bacteriovoracaceae bacterium]